MSILVYIAHAIYLICVIGLALYGFQALWLSWYYTRRSHQRISTDKAFSNWPTVSIHLPVYNERHVAERIIRACTKLNYPSDKLSIRVLDDSDDSTITIVNRAVQEAREQGIDIVTLRRPSRYGYKAGALAYALENECAEFVAIFDADFSPSRDFLVRTMPRFFDPGNERVGFVQTRWGHLNLHDSVLTRCQAVALDGHFVVEQNGRQAAGFAFGFNGSGGVWRRSCIEDPDVGGWQADTLCEDLDLSYRAQLAGWRGLYLDDVESPAEIPPQLLAFKRQQSRWAQGSIQTLRKIAPRVLSSDWSIRKRFAALLHLGAYLLHPMLLCLLFISLPMTLSDISPAPPLAVLSLLSVGPPLLYAIGQRHLYSKRWRQNFMLLPMLMLLGTGLSLNNSIAAARGLFGGKGEFLRTPKFNSTAEDSQWRRSVYRLPLQPILLAEAMLALYALTTAIVSALKGDAFTTAFLLLYVLAFGLVAMMGLWQDWSARSPLQPKHVGRQLETSPQTDLRPAGVSRDS